jgi:hypothetical protein
MVKSWKDMALSRSGAVRITRIKTFKLFRETVVSVI